MEQVYGLTNLALLTPQNLVENIQLENYLEIKYYKNEKAKGNYDRWEAKST